MTNETTASQPKSIGDDAQFMTLLNEANYTASEASVCGNDFGTGDKAQAAEDALITYIDNFRAPAAQSSATIQAAFKATDEMCIGARDKFGIGATYAENIFNHMMSLATIQEPVTVAEPVGEPVEYQFRTRADWHKHWSGWDRCTKEQHDEKLANPIVHDWHYEVRALGVVSAASMVAEPVAYADPKAFENFSAGTATNEWMWAKPDAGLVPLYRAAPMVADPAGVTVSDDRERFEALTLEKYAAATFERFTYGKYKTIWVQDHYEGWCMALAATVKAVPSEALTSAAHDVLAERQRQADVEGWTPEHDDMHDDGQMAVAAGFYALQCGYPHERTIWRGDAPMYWPWAASWWKPTTKRANLVKAGALILAEIERIDRAAPLADKTGGAA